LNAADLVAQSIPCTVTAANPLTALNVIGGDNITFTGTNFPYELKESTVKVIFQDAKKTECIP
jgi:hypothetical protein